MMIAADQPAQEDMEQDALLHKIWRENELPLLARSHRLYEEVAEAAQHGRAEAVFTQLCRCLRLPATQWAVAAQRVWEGLPEKPSSSEAAEFKALLAAAQARHDNAAQREQLRLWLWRRVVRSGKAELIASRFFADAHLFYRTLRDDKLIAWYGTRQVEWPVQLLLGLFLGGGEETERLRLKLYWPTARLPEDFQPSRRENRALRRLWEARILVRFGRWTHLHPEIMLLLPEISSFTAPVFEWDGDTLVAHMPDGRRWPVTPFALAALIFDETLALFGRDRQGWWRNFAGYAAAYLARPEDVASHFILKACDDLGLHLMREAGSPFLHELAGAIQYLEALRAAL
ncbi:MAG: hypothetical protein ONB48_17990 [candidate division KSB1 bacterium]|nr:hypothetical protein [candidate division KSB1 bacterium]MDZ7275783.1 hypothetical protein [candidate division KSB1 bacterium]MDZ7287535.1 hypothetical protein [candidate division KSB1 bacterium]MDZ7307961.1 hypothetical protein [candidate division KSB1 bacterium]MDZ7350513.1 hypothetical protein [candidate division KSB1 bacterium]